MDSSQSLAIESFSYSWLTNVNPCFEGLEVPLRPSIDISCELSFHKEHNNKVKNTRNSLEEPQTNFNFDVVPISQSADFLAHADQLFSGGLIKPGCVNQACISSPIPSSSSSKAVVPCVNLRTKVFGRWRRLSRRVLMNVLGYLTPLCLNQSRIASRTSKRVDDIDRRTCEVKSWNSSPQSSPRHDWTDIERSVHEAILHCKRSIDN